VKTARYCQLAAAQAEQRFAYREAARLWEQAIACLDQASDTPARDRLELVLRLVGALAQTGQLADARSWRRDAVRTALPLDDPALLAKVITAFDVPQLFQRHEYGSRHRRTSERGALARSRQTAPACAVARITAAASRRSYSKDTTAITRRSSSSSAGSWVTRPSPPATGSG